MILQRLHQLGGHWCGCLLLVWAWAELKKLVLVLELSLERVVKIFHVEVQRNDDS